TAGRGIVHSEMPEQEKGLLSGFQLWVNLPAAEKMCAPGYQDLEPERLASCTFSPLGSRVEVIAGEVEGLVGPVKERPTRPLLAYAMLEDERPLRLELPEEHTAFVFVAAGEVEIGPDSSPVREGQIALLSPGNRMSVRAAGSWAGRALGSSDRGQRGSGRAAARGPRSRTRGPQAAAHPSCVTGSRYNHPGR